MPHSNTMRCADCGSTHIAHVRYDTYVTTPMGLAMNRSRLTDAIRALDTAFKKLPPFGWYNIFRPAATAARKALPLFAHRPHRAQARRCHADARRWKRRQFLQSLRRAW